MLQKILDDTREAIAAAAHEVTGLRARETGTVRQVGGGIALIDGLKNVTSEELVRFRGGVEGIAVNLDFNEVGVLLLGKSDALSAGMVVSALGREADAPVGDSLLGRVIDPTGRPLDGDGALRLTQRKPLERQAPHIIHRSPVVVPLQTGIKAVDALIPIGRGQRELIVGDRQTGKTAVAVDTIINQKNRGVVCIYCAVGQRGSAVAGVVETLKHHGALDYTTVVVASDEDPPGLRYITPYAATTMAEYFMEKGRDTLVVYDDLTRHARAYRELSLLLRRPPGREAFPGDIFYIHSRLLERATRLCDSAGGGSMTALPIVETQAQDISAYIPTNLISITDGQIYLSPTLFHKGMLPAIDVGKSVSRVGGNTQFSAYRQVSSDLRLSYSQFEELEIFSRFATRLDKETRARIEHGRRVREILKQDEHNPLSASEQVSVLHAVNVGLLDKVATDRISSMERLIQRRVNDELGNICDLIEGGEELTDDDWKALADTSGRAIESGLTLKT